MTCESVNLQDKEIKTYLKNISNMEKTRSMIKKLDNIKWCVRESETGRERERDKERER